MRRPLDGWWCVLALAITVIVPGPVSAQGYTPPQPTARFVNLRSGDCQIVIELPSGQSLGATRLLRNGNETIAEGRRRRAPSEAAQTQRVTFTVQEPPQSGDQFTVTGPDFSPSTEIVKIQGPDRRRCRIKDEREAFAPTVLFGLVADDFAPNENRVYVSAGDDSERDPFKRKNSEVARVEAQLRVGGNNGGVLDRFWVGLTMKYGVRSTDLDCSGTDAKAPSCQNAFVVPSNPGGALTAAVLRASKIEAIIKPRYEFATAFPDSELPVALYVLGRFGFGQAPGEVKVENIYSAGAGVMLVSGLFRESGVETTWGVDRGYRTNPTGKRVRSDFKLLFGSPPGFLGQIPYLSKLVRAPRGLFEVVVDRNSLGPGPDGTQTFLGIVLDIKRVLP
jgi:hypothetical protein